MIAARFVRAGLLPALTALILCRVSADTLTKESPRMKVADKIPLKAIGFDLKDVRLLDGPFKHAMDLDHRYLLSLDPDRLLHNFRVNSGLPSSAQPLGGWEAPDCELRGHFVGHYLSACAEMVEATGDAKLKHNADYVVAELARCQAKLGNGYLSAYPETFIDRVEAQQRVWAPWYTLHKIYAGLMDMYVHCGNAQALEVARKFGDWAKHRTDRLSDEQMQRMLGNEHGGMNEAMANLYALTGDTKYLDLARRFNHHAVLDPLAHREDHLTGLHANTQIPKVIGAAREYELTGEGELHTIADFFWEVVTKERSYVIGGDSDGEHFSPKEKLSQYLSPTTTETCNTYNMLKLTRHLFEWDPKAEYADYYERALYNHILASQNPETGMMCYYVPLHSGSRKEFNSPNDSFWCCTGTGVENHAHYGDSIYFHDGGHGLYINLFIASQLDWKAKGVMLRQETRFPDEGATHLIVTCSHPVALDLHIRHPYWAASGYRILVNGKAVDESSTPGSYATVSRTWKSGDMIEIEMPMQLRTEAFKDNPHKLAFLYGPIVLCAPTGASREIPVIVAPDDRILTGITPEAGQPLKFRCSADLFRAGEGESAKAIRLAPFYKTADSGYVVYWDVFTEAQWQEKQAVYRAEAAQRKEIEARTVDLIHPGEEQNERDHKMDGKTTYAGDFGERKWRDARDGGWFSYEVKVLPDTAQELICTYWGGDGGGRDFDILVDGVKVATERLAAKRPNHFYSETYVLPSDLLRGKQQITVRFQAHPGRMAGGIFEFRVAKQKETQP
jgi:DUF1680 family protein